MAINKTYDYKVYKPVKAIVKNLVEEADFEGETNRRLAPTRYYTNFWQAAGSTVSRTRIEARNRELGKAARFNGVNSRIRFPSQTHSLNTINRVTVSAWVNLDWANKARQAIVSADYLSGSITGGWGLHMNHSAPGFIEGAGFRDTSFISFFTKANSTHRMAYYRPTLTGWHLVTGRFNGTTVSIFIDGVLQHSDNFSGTFNIDYGSANTGNPGIGAQRQETGDATNYWLNGDLDNVAIYDFALTDAQVLQLYEDQSFIQTGTGGADALNLFDFDSPKLGFDILNGREYPGDNLTQINGHVGKNQSIRIKTISGGATQQGLESVASTSPTVLASQLYTASAYIKGASGETATLELVPIGGGTTLTSTITLNGEWQRISRNITTASTTTRLQIRVLMNNASTAVKNMYVDQVMLEEGGTLHNWFDKNSTNTSTEKYRYNTAGYHQADITEFQFLQRWNKEVVNDFNYPQEINSAGSEVRVILARPADNYGEKVDIDFNHKVIISAIDTDTPQGVVKFQGYIANYKPSFGGENLEITLLGYGSQANNYMIEAGSSTHTSQEDISGVERGVNNSITSPSYIGQGFKAGANQTNINKIEVRMRADSTPYINYKVYLRVWDSYTAAKTDSRTGSTSSYTPLASAEVTTMATTMGWVAFNLDTLAKISPEQQLYWTITVDTSAGSGEPTTHKIAGSDIDPHSGGFMFRDEGGMQGNTEYLNTDLAFRVYANYGSTQISFNSVDPSNILRQIIDDFNRQGGLLSYTATSIKDTATVVSYPVNTMTVWEGMKKVLELAPVGWYLRINQATNEVEFKHKDDAPKHKFILGKHIDRLDFDKRSEGIINTIYFTGGEISPGVNLYRKYVNQTSVDLYGVKLLKLIDNRVILNSTADIMANAILEGQNFPEARTTLGVIDGQYDIESINDGDVVEFGGFGGDTASGSIWDVSEWDEGYWDFDITNPESLQLQIARLDYTPDRVGITLSTTPPDVNKRVQDIQRQLDSVQTDNNPVEPTNEEL